MKTAIIVIALLFSLPSQATMCRCTCDPKNMNLCESSYDLDRPCNGVCPAQASSVLAPARTACPLVQVNDELRGTQVWLSLCGD